MKGLVTRKGLDVSRRADRCSAEGEKLGATPRSCLNPLSLCNNGEGGGGDNVRLPQNHTPLPTPPSPADSLLISCPSTHFLSFFHFSFFPFAPPFLSLTEACFISHEDSHSGTKHTCCQTCDFMIEVSTDFSYAWNIF